LAISTINKFTQGDVEGEEDEDSIFLSTASAPDSEVQIGALPVDEDIDYGFDEDAFEECLAEIDDHGPV
jgi:hypothetical protein